MSTYTDLRDAIEAILESITDVGTVFDYRPHLKVDTEYFTGFHAVIAAESDKDVIQAWFINAPTEAPRLRWHTGGYVRDFTFILQGYRAVGSYTDDGDSIPEGATEKPFRDLCDLVMRTFMANPGLMVGDVVYAIGFRRAPTLRMFGAINLGPILAHYAEVVLTPFTSCFLDLT